MLQPNSPDINVTALNLKVQRTATYRRRTNPLFSAGYHLSAYGNAVVYLVFKKAILEAR